MRRKSLPFLALGVVFLLLAGALHRWAPTVGDTALGVLAGLGAGALFAGLLLWCSPEMADSAQPAIARRYRREFLPPMAAYLVLLWISTWLLKRVDEPALRALLALLPVAPIALAVRAIVRYIRDVDELQQRIELEAVSTATALVTVAYLGAGFLQLAKVIDVPSGAAMIWVFPLVCLVYGVAMAVVVRRYR